MKRLLVPAVCILVMSCTNEKKAASSDITSQPNPGLKKGSHDSSKEKAMYNSNDLTPLHALPLRQGQTLPEGGALVGKEKKHYILPVTGSAKEVAEPGDILIFFDDYDPNEKGLFQMFTRGMYHAAVVARDSEGELIQVHAPSLYSGRDFSRAPYPAYHILRLREDVPGVLTDKESPLYEHARSYWPTAALDAISKEKYKEWREVTLKNINRHLNQFYNSTYRYDNPRITEFNRLEKEGEFAQLVLRDAFEGMTLPPFYCSELTFAAYAVEGFPAPTGASMFSTLMPQIDAQVLASKGNYKNILERTLRDRATYVIGGSNDEEINTVEKTGDFTKTGLGMKYMAIFGTILETPADVRDLPKYREATMKRVQSLEPLLKSEPVLEAQRAQGSLIGVAHLFDSVQREGNPFTYVGTVVAPQTEGKPLTITGQELSQASLAKEHANFKHEAIMHTFPILDMVVANTKSETPFVATISTDELLRVYNVNTKMTRTIDLEYQPKKLELIQNDLLLVTLMNDSVRMFHATTGEAHNAPEGTQANEMTFEGKVEGRTVTLGEQTFGHLRPVTKAARLTWKLETDLIVTISGESIFLFRP